MKVRFENCEVELSSLVRGVVVLHIRDTRIPPDVYHLNSFVGFKEDNKNLVVYAESAAGCKKFLTSELVWPNP